MKISWRRLFLIICAFIIAFIGLKVFNNIREYNEDVSYIYSIAGKLGYTPESFIHFYHDDTVLYYDDVKLTFVTDKTFEDFSASVDGLRLIPYKTYDPWKNHSFLRYLNSRSDVKGLSLAQRNEDTTSYTKDQLDPMVMKWVLRDGKRRVEIEIEYLDTNARNDVWTYGGVPLSGNIAVVSMDRHDKF